MGLVILKGLIKTIKIIYRLESHSARKQSSLVPNGSEQSSEKFTNSLDQNKLIII